MYIQCNVDSWFDGWEGFDLEDWHSPSGPCHSKMAVSIWFNKDCTVVKCATKVFQPDSASLNYNVPIHGFDISIWRKSASRLQAAAQPYRVSPVIGQPGSPCKNRSGTHFLRKKVSSLGHLTLGIFFFLGFIPTYCIFFEGSDIWRLCSEFLCNGDEFGGSQAALQFIFDIRGINKHEKQSVLPPLFEHPSWRSEACHGH